MMKMLRVSLLIVMVGFVAGCATGPQRSTSSSTDSSGRIESNEGWPEWMFDQIVGNLLGNVVGWVF